MLACTRRKSRADWVTTEYLRYGEDAPDAVDHNLRGRVWRVFDQAGMVASEAHDYRGNLIESTRRLTQAYTGTIDWAALAEATTEEDRDDEADALLYAEVFTTTSTFDALGRPMETHPPRSSDGVRATTHARTVRMAYNRSGLLARVEVQLGDDEASFDTYVDSITYNARRQRTGIVYGNGVETALSYDAESFRLTRLYTTREVATDTFVGQDRRYAYDAVGNITRMDDHAVMVDDEERMVHAGPQLAEPVVHAYTYDALGRLIAATGREHPGLLPTTTPLQPGSSGYDRGGPHPNDLAALEDYVEQYTYDAVGNFVTMQHTVPSDTTHSWTRYYLYDDIGNRLTKTHGGNATGTGSYSYGYDEHGNMLAMPHLAEMDWNAYDELTRTDNGGGAGRVEHHFQYDASGQRVRKVVEHYTSGAATLIEERVYFGGFELYRRHQGAGSGLDKEVVKELQTLHVMDGEQRVALVDTRTVEMAPEDEDPTVLGVGGADHAGGVPTRQSSRQRVPGGRRRRRGRAVRGVPPVWEQCAALCARGGGRRAEAVSVHGDGVRRHRAAVSYSRGTYAPWLGRWTSTDPMGAIAPGVAMASLGLVEHAAVASGNSSQAQVDQDNHRASIPLAAASPAGAGAILTGVLVSATTGSEPERTVETTLTVAGVLELGVTGMNALRRVPPQPIRHRAGARTRHRESTSTAQPERLPFVAQSELYSCSPAAGSMCAASVGHNVTEAQLMNSASYVRPTTPPGVHDPQAGMYLEDLATEMNIRAPVRNRTWQVREYFSAAGAPTDAARMRSGLQRTLNEGGGIATLEVRTPAGSTSNPWDVDIQHSLVLDEVQTSHVIVRDPGAAGAQRLPITSSGFGQYHWDGVAMVCRRR
jgi:hypothetical protein